MEENNAPYSTMSICSLGPATLPKSQKRVFAIKDTNNISDIVGTRSGPKYTQYTNKPQFSQSDVQGSTSKPLIHSRNVRDNTLYIDDIDGTRHMIRDRFMRTGRHVDPLEPQYKLPSFQTAEIPEPKFVKDPLQLNDIDKTSSRVKNDFKTRDVLNIDDIDGTRTKPRFQTLMAQRDILNTQDVPTKNLRMQDRTSRCVDPNNPVYQINGMIYEDDPKSKPKPLKKEIAAHFLQTRDIAGAYPGWEPTQIVRRDYRNTNYIGDISGACADSIKHSITTKRQVHPLNPVYQSLDGDSLQPLITPLIPPSMVKVPTISVPKSSLPISKTNEKTEFPSLNQAQDASQDHYDPVSFTNDQATSSKPPPGKITSLDLSSTNAQNPSGMVSFRKTDTGLQPASHRSNPVMNTTQGATGRSSGGWSSGRSGGGFTSGRNSGFNSGYNSGRVPLTPQEKRSMSQLNDDISAIRDLK